jgi:hypothetical protein
MDLRVCLIDASNGNVDPQADITPILGLIAQGCDLDLDVLPVVARLVPDLPRPLKNWAAPWLTRDILAARDMRGLYAAANASQRGSYGRGGGHGLSHPARLGRASHRTGRKCLTLRN